MEEQPVALATSRRSPNSCVTSLMYGVSPQPAQAPENSKSGSSNCEFLMVANVIRAGSISGSLVKKSQLTDSTAAMGSIASILIALRPTRLLSFTGHASTQRPQLVQSSGETCSVYCMSGNSLYRAGV